MRFVPLIFAFVLLIAPLTTEAAFEFVQIVPEECSCESVQVEGGSGTTSSAPGYGCVLQVVQNIIRMAITFGFVVATFALIYAGFMWMTSGTNAERRNQGSHLLLNVFVGLFIMLGAWLLIDFMMKAIYNDQSEFGPWNNILAGNGESGNFCLTARESESIASGVVGVVTEGSSPGGSGSDGNAVSSQNLANEVAKSRLRAAGVDVKEGATLNGTQENVINQVIALKQACNCDVVVTSGTDGSHAIGSVSHSTGYKVDLRTTERLTTYIESFRMVGRRSNGDPRYQDSCGNEYVRESNHWDVTVSRGVCSLPVWTQDQLRPPPLPGR